MKNLDMPFTGILASAAQGPDATVDMLLVGGGGGGGAGGGGGGGGGGGVLYYTGLSIVPGSRVDVVVGAGGASLGTLSVGNTQVTPSDSGGHTYVKVAIVTFKANIVSYTNILNTTPGYPFVVSVMSVTSGTNPEIRPGLLLTANGLPADSFIWRADPSGANKWFVSHPNNDNATLNLSGVTVTGWPAAIGGGGGGSGGTGGGPQKSGRIGGSGGGGGNNGGTLGLSGVAGQGRATPASTTNGAGSGPTTDTNPQNGTAQYSDVLTLVGKGELVAGLRYVGGGGGGCGAGTRPGGYGGGGTGNGLNGLANGITDGLPNTGGGGGANNDSSRAGGSGLAVVLVPSQFTVSATSASAFTSVTKGYTALRFTATGYFTLQP